jgi:ABC-2 type transport system permease protein
MLLYLIGLPLIELFLFAYAISLTVYHLPTAIVDQSQDQKSRAFVQALINSTYFDATLHLGSEKEAMQAIDAGQVKVAVVIPPKFADNIDKSDANVLILLDGTDNFSVASGVSAASAIAQNYALQLTSQTIAHLGGNSATAASAAPIVTSTRVLYNPDLKDLWFLLPTLIGLIMQTLAVGQSALVVVKEREVGTIEQILATPTRPLELIVAKMIPLLGLCIVMTGVVLGLGMFWFGVPFQGSLWLYFWLALLFMASSLGLGLLVSSITKTQQQAQQMTSMLMVFSMLLTGVIYPRLGMPLVPQIIGDLLPLTYFIRISRGIMTKGVGLTFFWSDAVILVIYTIVVLVIAGRSFGKRLD